MSALTGKVDFLAVVTVTKANPNGDPLNGNRPRENYNGTGEISDVCLKRKIRNRLQDMGQEIFVQSNDRTTDGLTSLRDRADAVPELKAELAKKNADADAFASIACKKWLDVRAFGQVFAFKGTSVSVGVRGPVSIHSAVSVTPVDITSMQITKSVNSEAVAKGARASDTMGMKHRVEFGAYIVKGSINCQLAEKTGFSGEDALAVKEALKTLFENDASAARPDGSMEVSCLYWWQHAEKTPAVTSAMLHRSVKVTPAQGVEVPQNIAEFNIVYTPCGGPEPEIYDFR